MAKIIPIYRRTEPPQGPAAPISINTTFASFYRCGFCPYRSQLLTSITDHLSYHNSRTFRDLFSCANAVGDTYQCPSCDIRGPLKVLLTEHVKLRHLQLDVAPTFFNKPHECPVGSCGFKAHSKIYLQEHAAKKRCQFARPMCKVDVSKVRRPKMPRSRQRDPLSIGVTAIMVKNAKDRFRERIGRLKIVLPQAPPPPRPKSKFILPKAPLSRALSQSIIFQCGRCLYSSVNQPILIKQHLMSQHFKGHSSRVMYRYDVCKVSNKLTMMMDALKWPLCGKHVNYFQCKWCQYRTRMWDNITVHVKHYPKHDEFYEVVDKL